MICLVNIDSEIAVQLLELEKANLGLIEEACKILNIKLITKGSNMFVSKLLYDNKEDGLKDILQKSILGLNSCTFFYKELDRNHHIYYYYNVIGFVSDQLVDIKKILKIQKLKAFL